MPKAIEDDGHRARATKPLALRRYEAGKLPDPGQCVDCAIIVNDRSDGVPRARLAISNGASWDFYVREDEIGTSKAVGVRPVERDITPMIQAAVDAALPALVTAPAVKVIQGPQSTPNDVKELAAAMLDISGHVNGLANEHADLRAELETLKEIIRANDRIEFVTGIKAAS